MKPDIFVRGFLFQCEQLNVGIDLKTLYHICVNTTKHLKGSKDDRVDTLINQQQEQEWYASLEAGSPNYSIYSSQFYLGELFACFVVYSRQHLRNIQKPGSFRKFIKCSPQEGLTVTKTVSIVERMGRIASVLDLGCGLGYTSVGLKSIFSEARVVGFDIDGSIHFEFAKGLAKRNGFEMVNDLAKAPRDVDLIFASEYFEHIVAPIDHLKYIIAKFSPKYLLIANAFGTKAIGHFDVYDVDGEKIDGKKTSILFNVTLKSLGYKKMKTNLWNNRPAFWVRSDGLLPTD